MRQIKFAGYDWYVHATTTASCAGTNYWSDDKENVWIDTDGHLHLKITNRDNIWWCAEVSSMNSFGYGTYWWNLKSNLASVDKNVVAATFCYYDDAHEVDIEYTGWGNINPSIVDLTVQPPPTTYRRIPTAKITAPYEITQWIKWLPTGITIGVALGTYKPTDIIPATNIIANFESGQKRDATGAVADMNIWLFNHLAPSNYQPSEMVISDFKFLSP